MTSTFHLRQGQETVSYSSSLTATTIEEIDSIITTLATAKALINTEYCRVADLRLTILREKSAFRRIPPEIFHLIFLKAAEVTEIHWCRPVIAISQTCQRWRAIAFSSPKLWSTFAVNLAKFHYRRETMEWYLLHSKDYPLSMEARLSDDLGDGTVEELENLFIQCAPRIRSLTIDTPWWSDTLNGLLRKYDFSLVKSFDIRLVSHSESLDWALERMPALSSLRYSIGLAPHDIPSLEKLSSVELDISNDYLPCLRGCLQLENLTLINTRFDLSQWDHEVLWGDQPPLGPPVVLKELHAMYLVVESRQRYVQNALTSIKAPHLEHLAIDASEEDIIPDNWTVYNEQSTGSPWLQKLTSYTINTQLTDFLQTSGQSLSTLELIGISMTDVELLSALYNVVSLRKLVIGDTQHSLKSVYPVTNSLIMALKKSSFLPGLVQADFWSAAKNRRPPCLHCCVEMGISRDPIFRHLTVSVPRFLSHDASEGVC
ncbi:hypothetical protein BT96DRAFT_1003504 [Gymnopus androsaceus JB14]|uniref:Uncharacterized protein n=1 Tax=Gymnopus androsaceus JB14 TaxID=1447944 RepID=A0A6A4GVT2_9AGAR|nr:hypothetical protein BT96DRAFT_1003504 [Gymnopus androsaceus JB14]